MKFSLIRKYSLLKPGLELARI